MEEAIVLYPSSVLSHQMSMVELAKLLLTHQPSLSIHILLVNQADSAVPFSSATLPPSITFHHLPAVTLPPSAHPDPLGFELLRVSNPNLHRALLTISDNYKINAFIFHFFCVAALKVASDLHLPAYCFHTPGASPLASLLYLPILHQKFTGNFKDLNVLLDIPGVPSIPSSDMPGPVLVRNKLYENFLDISKGMGESAGIIVNTFESLEARSIKTISDGLCVPGGRTPPIYCIGPINNGGAVANDDGEGNLPECLKWLGTQPSKSVVFLCFGSLGSFPIPQLREIAVGLERSGQRFLWVVKNPPSENQNKQTDPDLNSLLPQGFLERTKERGLVVKSWAPQVEVLNHDSVGGFVTHCGWNSVLESVCAGVPMVGWPLYAEQRYNRVVLVEEMKIALPMVAESETEFVSSSEVEKRVRELMESKEGNSVRKRTIAMKQAAEAAMKEGGSSRVALAKLFELWK